MQKQNLDGKSMDIVKSNIDKLKQIFPDVFSEGQINFEKLQAVLGEHICEDEEHYKFTWHGKKKAEHEATKTRSTGTLRPDIDDSKNWDSTNNVFIEGDNLEVLKLLQKSYHNKIKMIYIDPPYNTGKDFVYKDNYKDTLGNYKKITGQVDSEGMAISSNTDKSGRYHTDWLNMMYPRLKLARNLLKDDGVIFISIDDNEQANLKKLCDEIFGEDNFVGEFLWNKSQNPPSLSKKIRHKYEYVLSYSKGFITRLNGGVAIGGDSPIYNGGNNESILEFPINSIKFNISDGVYFAGNRSMTELLDDVTVRNGTNTNSFKLRGKFRWSQETLLREILEKTEICVKSDSFVPRYLRDGERIITPSDILSLNENNVDTNERGRKEIDSLSLKGLFDFPKPTSLIRYLSNMVTYDDKKSIILDFFAGSGTTGDAVMQLNAEDGGNRKYICVQLDEPISEKDNKEAYKFCTDPENNFKPVISSITKERLRRAGVKIITDAKKELAELLEKKRPDQEKIKIAQEKLSRLTGCHSVLDTESPNYIEMLNQVQHDNSKGLDIGFKAFKLDTSNIKPWDGKIESFDQLQLGAVDNIKQSRSTDDVLFEILLKLGLDLTVPVETIYCKPNSHSVLDTESHENSILYNIGMGALLICLDNANDAVISEIIKIKKDTDNSELEVVFKDEVFESDVAKTNYSQQLESAGIKTIKVI